MPRSSLLRPLALAAAVALLPSAPSLARDLGNFDLNARQRAKAAPSTPANVDAIGRATFTWVQADLPAGSKAAAAGDAVALARAHVTQLLGQAKVREDAAGILLDAKAERQPGGTQLVRFTPRIGGIAVFHEDLALLMDGAQRLVAMRGPLPRESADDAKRLPAFELEAADAIAVALGAHEFGKGVAAQLQPVSRKGDEYQWFRLAPGTKSASGAVAPALQRARAVWFRTRAGLQPAWYVETEVSDTPAASADMHAFVVSARDGSLLFRKNLTEHAAFTYSVWAEPGPGFLPYPNPQGRAATPDPDGLPTNNTAPLAAPELRTLSSLAFSRGATDPWLPDGATATNGNNVFAFADLAAPDGTGTGDIQPSATGGVFDFGFNLAQAPNASQNQTLAATVHLFFTINWLHDTFYDHGFAEVDGNAQDSNYGRGGQEGDYIRADAQDYDVEDNANMSTPADGNRPRMQMGLSSDSPVTDYSLDSRTIAHEWGHYLSNRLIGDATGLSTEHSRGMGEGWSDFVAQLVLVKEEDRQKPGNDSFQGAYGGGYNSHSYYSFRRYPLSTDIAKNPLSLRHISLNVPLPVNPMPRYGQSGSNNTQVHSQGEIWAAALWEGYAALLRDDARLSFAEAQSRMMDYLIGGMKMTPVAPTMIEARDAILATVLANGRQEDFALLVAAFAKRGLGAGANIPDRYSDSMSNTTEGTSTGSDIEVRGASLGVPTGCDADAVLDQGETAKLSVTVGNSGFAALADATLRVTASHPAVTFPQGDTIQVGSLPLFGAKTVSVPIAVTAALPPNTPVAVFMTPNAPGIQSPPGLLGMQIVFTNFDEMARGATFDDFAGNATDWQYVRAPAGTQPGGWSVYSEASTRFLHGDDTASRAVSWAQTPAMAVGAGPLTVTLQHRYSFENDDEDDTHYDGGVVQASVDGGATWTDVALPGSGILSDCCDNPFAGKQAFVDRNLGYPGFSTTTLALGTAFANQANFKLRFGVATDAAVDRGGWDIDRIDVAGLADTPFTAAVPNASSCPASGYKTLQGPLSGTYYSTSRSGEGVLVDFGQVGTTPVVFFSWYTYEGGQQQWLVGSAPFSTSDTGVALDLIETSGAAFGSQFRPADVVNTPWGSAALSFPSCDTLQLTYRKLDGEAGTITMQRGLARLEQAQCNVLHGGLSGTYYSTQRSGEGVLVDFGKAGNDPVEFFTWYTYEGGEQRWLVGSKRFAPGDSSISVDLIRTQGAEFGNDFRSQDVVNAPWGTVTQRFVDCDTLELSYQKSGGEAGTLTLKRGLQRLGDGVCR